MVSFASSSSSGRCSNSNQTTDSSGHAQAVGCAATAVRTPRWSFPSELEVEGYRIGELSCPTRSFEDASSISFTRSIRYGFGVLTTSIKFRLQRMGLGKLRIFNPPGKKLLAEDYYAAGEDEVTLSISPVTL